MDANGMSIDGMTPERQPAAKKEEAFKFDCEANVRAIESAIGVANEVTDLLALADMEYRLARSAFTTGRLIDEFAGMNGSGTSDDSNNTLETAVSTKARGLRHRLVNWLDYLDSMLGYSALIALVRPDNTSTSDLQADYVLRQRAELEHLNQIVLSRLAANELPEKAVVVKVIAATTTMAALLDKELRPLEA